MRIFQQRFEELQSLIIRDYDALCRFLAFDSKKVKESLNRQDSVAVNFNDLDTLKQVELAENVNIVNGFNLNIDKSFMVFEDSADWTLSLHKEEDSEQKEEFIELVESWSITIALPYSLQEIYSNKPFEERFEGMLYFFFAELLDDYTFSDTIRRGYFVNLLDGIIDALNHYDKILLKSKDMPVHLSQSFKFLKDEYQKAYKLIYTEFYAQISAFYQFDSKFISKEKRASSDSNYFIRHDGVTLPTSVAQEFRNDLVDKKLICNQTNYLTLKKAFYDGSPCKINWIGGKDKLGCLIKILKDKKIIKGQAHRKARDIFNLDNEPILKLRNPKQEDTINYIDEFKDMVDTHFNPQLKNKGK
ncbi:MAG: hypothetical protein Tsb0033_15420 [Winogradskyella sp.]